MPYPRVSLLPGASALESLPNLSAHLGNVRVSVKRDDLGGRGAGGNKLRKYERLLGDALVQGADTVVIAGHDQSNAARACVGACRQVGLDCVVVAKTLIPSRGETFKRTGNALLMHLMGAEIIPIGLDEDFVAALDTTAAGLRARGKRPYVIPFGGSNLLGALGYVDATREISEQAPDANVVVTPCGSAGTQAGLVAGFRGTPTRVLGVSVLPPAADARARVAILANEVLAVVDNTTPNVRASDIHVDDAFIGGGYGHPTPAGVAAIRLLARLEALLLCPVYTGKAVAGLLHYVETGVIRPGEHVVFVHTGGAPLVHAYQDVLIDRGPYGPR